MVKEAAEERAYQCMEDSCYDVIDVYCALECVQPVDTYERLLVMIWLSARADGEAVYIGNTTWMLSNFDGSLQ